MGGVPVDLATRSARAGKAMTLNEYQGYVASVSHGKRLPGALYVFRDDESNLGAELNQLLAQLAVVFEGGPQFNVVKFRTDELKVSFLSYPEFMNDAHPSLHHALTIDLASGTARRTDYATNLNPPILHRKEAFLVPEHPKRALFASLTTAEEAEGLYDQTATIGFKLNWERLLEEKGLVVEGHALRKVETKGNAKESLAPLIERHKTALTRYELSKPVKTLLEYGLLKPGTTFFDYGCGQGSDVKGLQGLGHEAEGWDPVHRPSVSKRKADIVNLGYVLNVVEDPAERLDALVDAHQHAKQILVVAGLIQETIDTANATTYRDGVLTRRNTFQKYFEQQELQQYIEDALDTTAVPVALGVFYVFRNPVEQQDFLSARSRRSIDWAQISSRLGLGSPTTVWKALYEKHKELLDKFGSLALKLGRLPGPLEFNHLMELEESLGSLKRALRAYVQGSGVQGLDWDAVRVRFGIGMSAKRRWEVLYEEHRELLDAFWSLMLQLGRLPEPEEFSKTGELLEKVGSPKQALRLFIQKGGADDVKRSMENRQRDLLVYVALANLRKRVLFGHLSLTLRSDIRAFFGNYTRALEKGIELLYSAGDLGEIELACENLQFGWQDDQALYFHKSLLDKLPPLLRVFVGCAAVLYGDVNQADIIKLHKASGKITFLIYDDFHGKPLPELQQRIKVDLRSHFVQVFDHSKSGQLLYFKERYVGSDYLEFERIKAFSSKLVKLGINANVGFGPTKLELAEILARHNLNGNLNRCRTR